MEAERLKPLDRYVKRDGLPASIAGLRVCNIMMLPRLLPLPSIIRQTYVPLLFGTYTSTNLILGCSSLPNVAKTKISRHYMRFSRRE